MAYTTIKKPSDYFNTKLYTGNGGTNAITGVGFQPDFTWLKRRNSTGSHLWQDVIRGANYNIRSDKTDAEADSGSIHLNSFDTDGFTVAGTGTHSNDNGSTYASWNWLANGTGSANTDGSISSTVSASTTSGFSVVKLDTGTSGNISFGHGLGVAPKVVIIKTTSGGGNWIVGHDSIGWGKYLNLNNGNAEASDSTVWQNTAPTNSVVTTNSTFIYNTGSTIVAYCFAEKQGYSKFGSYTGNGNADGTFIYTGFKPAWIMCKKYNVGGNWIMFDNKREPFNLNNDFLQADLSDAEVTGNSTIRCDFVSNGVKLRGTNNAINTSGGNYIFMAFAEQPLVGDNPATAR